MPNYQTRMDLQMMVADTVRPMKGHYDIEAIGDYLWQKTDMDSGFLTVYVGEFWAIIRANRLDTEQLRSVEALIRMIADNTSGDLVSVEYSRDKGNGNPVLTATMDADEMSAQYKVYVSDMSDNAPVVEIHEVIRTGDYDDPKEDLNQIMRTTDLARGLAKLTELMA